MKFTEEKLEHAFTELLNQEGFLHQFGESISRSKEEVIIEADLRSFLINKYEDEGITNIEVSSIIQELKSLPSSDLYESNKRFNKMLSDGFILKRDDRNEKDLYIQLIDFAGLEKQKQLDEDSLVKLAAREEPLKIVDYNIYKFVT